LESSLESPGDSALNAMSPLTGLSAILIIHDGS
jgi:hypothetical protein